MQQKQNNNIYATELWIYRMNFSTALSSIDYILFTFQIWSDGNSCADKYNVYRIDSEACC